MKSKTSKGFKSFINGVGDFVSSTISRSVDLTMDVLDGTLELGENIVSGEFDKIPETLKDTWVETAENFHDNTIDMIDGAIDSADGAVKMIKGIPQDLQQVVVNTGGKIGEEIGGEKGKDRAKKISRVLVFSSSAGEEEDDDDDQKK